MTGPLDGIRIVELGVWVAGPAAAGIAADWGADVIKVESRHGDPMRKMLQQKWDADRSEVMVGAQKGINQRDALPTFESFLNADFAPIRRSRWNKATRAKLGYYFNLMCESFGPPEGLVLREVAVVWPVSFDNRPDAEENGKSERQGEQS